jgi:hypothetical protein
MELGVEQEGKGSNPVLFIGISLAVAVVIITATTVSFFRSSAYMTVKQIQIGIESVDALSDGKIDMLSPIKAEDIDIYAENLTQRLKLIDDNADFGPDAVSDSSLKLQ